MTAPKQFFIANDKTIPFLLFIDANRNDLTIFDDEYNSMRASSAVEVTLDALAERIAFKYSYNYEKFIDAVLLFLGIEDDAVNYMSEKYLNTIH